MNNLPPGWYDDGSGRKRWWDGRKWTVLRQLAKSEPDAPSGEPPLFSYSGKSTEGAPLEVFVYDDRIEWVEKAGVSGAKVAAGILTGGISLLATGTGKGSYSHASSDLSVLRFDSVTGVSSKRQGFQVAVQVSSPSLSFTLLMGRGEAHQFARQLEETIRQHREKSSQAASQPAINVSVGNFNREKDRAAADTRDAAGPAQPDLVGQLQELSALHEQGVLSTDEFQAMKARLLNL